MLLSVALRCGYPHHDYLLPQLDAAQLRDLELLHHKYSLSLFRDDIHWAIAIADFRNANREKGELPERPADVSPYMPDPLDEEITREELLTRVLPSRIRPAQEPDS